MKIQPKKMFFAALLFSLTAALTGCAMSDKSDVKKAVKAELDQLKNPGDDTIRQYLSSDDLFPENQEESASRDIGPEITEIFTQFFEKFSYHIDKINVNKTNATATVTVKNIDANALARDYTAAALKKRITSDANPSQVEFSLKDSYLLLGNTLKNNEYKLKETTFDMNLKCKKEKWTVQHDEDLDNKLTGHFLSYMADSNLLTPEEVVEIHFGTIQEFDTEQLNIYLSLDSLLDTDDTYSSSIAHAMAAQIGRFFDFELLDSKNDQRNATVNMRITSSDFKSIMDNYQENLAVWLQTSEAFSGGAKGRREKERKLLLESIEQNNASTVTEIAISLVNDGMSWKMQMNEDIAQAILGGVDSALADVSEDVE